MLPEDYMQQVDLLIRILPYVARHDLFALKGGSAINLFYRDLPRLSVDIDLTYLPIQDRATSLMAIDRILEEIRCDIIDNMTDIVVRRISGGGDNNTRILVQEDDTQIKIETSPVIRGTVHPTELRTACKAVSDHHGVVEIRLLSFEDLYSGKLNAALDRQHPRDLFDVKLLYENEGLTDALFRTFLIYVASSGRPPHELIKPSFQEISQAFFNEFSGMSTIPVSLDELTDVRARLVRDLHSRLDNRAMRFLLSLHDGSPDFEAIGLPQAADLPAVRWKVLNLNKLKQQNPDKHAEQRRAIEALLS